MWYNVSLCVTVENENLCEYKEGHLHDAGKEPYS